MSTEFFLNPIEVLNKLNLQKDIIAVDFGCGSGSWTVPLAKLLEDGMVYAIDILEEPLSVLKSRARLEKIENIRVIRADLELGKKIPIESDSVDLVLMTNLLFQIEDKNKKRVFAEAKRILKKGGKILVIDWKNNAPLGPEKGRILPEKVKKIAEEFDFKLEKEFEAGRCHYGLIFDTKMLY